MLTKTFAASGLRSLLVAMREYEDEAELTAFMREVRGANGEKTDKAKWDRQLKAIVGFEREMELVGCTAIEDKLQVGAAAGTFSREDKTCMFLC